MATDDQWRALVGVLGGPAWALDPTLATAAGRVAHHDAIDRELALWCRDRTADEVVDALWPAGVPVAPVLHPHRQVDLAPIQRRGYFEEVDHPVTGRSRLSTLPIAFDRRPARWHRRPAPRLGEHTAEVLGGLGLSDDELVARRADGVIG